MNPLRRLRVVALAILAAPASIALGHGGGPDHVAGPRDWHELWRSWSLEPGVVIPLALAAWLYGRGLARLWRVAGVGRGIRRWEASSFAAGWLGLAPALVSPRTHSWSM